MVYCCFISSHLSLPLVRPGLRGLFAARLSTGTALLLRHPVPREGTGDIWAPATGRSAAPPDKSDRLPSFVGYNLAEERQNRKQMWQILCPDDAGGRMAKV